MWRNVMRVALGLALYVGLALALFLLHRLAVPSKGGLYPLWYSGGELLLKAAIAVGPGLAAGWLCRTRGLATGAIVGALGGVIDVVMVPLLVGIPLREFGTRIAVGAVATAIASGLTNAVGAVAGEALRAKFRAAKTAPVAPPPPPRRRRRVRVAY